MTLGALLVVLSASSRLQPKNYSLPGPCPDPPASAQLFEGRSLYPAYTAAMRFDSDPVSTQDLNCVHMYFPQRDAHLQLTECGEYDGLLTTNVQQFSIVLRPSGRLSRCVNQTFPAIQLSLWTDIRKELLLLWSCTADQQGSHRQVATVFIALGYFEYSMEKRVTGAALVERVRKFAKDTLVFGGLRMEQFEVNQRLLEEGAMDTHCSIDNCTMQCPKEPSTRFGVLLLVLFVCVIVLVLFMAMV